jgi:hypothetical protein
MAISAPLYHPAMASGRPIAVIPYAHDAIRFGNLDSEHPTNWIFALPEGRRSRNHNTVPTSASGMKPAISPLVTDSLRFVIFGPSYSAPGSFPLVPSIR